MGRNVAAMGYRVEELARRCGLTVDTIRFYQTRGLLPPPAREGRHAVYDDAHVERLERIRALKEQGFRLELIRRTLDGELDVAEQALAGALAADAGSGDQAEPLTREQLAQRAGVPDTLLEALEREGLLVPGADEPAPYDTGDLAAVQAGSALLEAGLPLSELLALAREHDQAMRAVAERAVDLFARFVRDPALGRAGGEPDTGQAPARPGEDGAGGPASRAGDHDAASPTGDHDAASPTDDHDAASRGSDHDAEAVAEHVVGALQATLPAATAIVAHHFRRRLLAAARARLEGA
jgi:DNA-binding transcriptional MerR regulator